MGIIDRIIKITIVATVIILYFTGHLSGIALLILGILSGAFIITSLTGFCPLYQVFGISTIKK
jgi:hypothetical protein